MRPSLNAIVRLRLGLVAGLITTALLPTGIGALGGQRSVERGTDKSLGR